MTSRDREITRLTDEALLARMLARRLFATLRARTSIEAITLFDDPEMLRIVEPVFDAAETVWTRHRVLIEPCRVVADPSGDVSLFCGWPVQGEMYLATWPDGNTRNLTRDQVLMMGGMVPEGGGR